MGGQLRARQARVRMNLHLDAQHFAAHPAQAHAQLTNVEGDLKRLLRAYPDDPALASPLLLERLPAMIGQLTSALLWAEEYDSRTPDMVPMEGATV